MNLKQKVVLAALFAVAGTPFLASAQVEKLPHDEMSQLQKKLGGAKLSPAMKGYVSQLKTLQPDAAQRAVAEINALRIAEDMEQAKLDGSAGFVVYSVPALSSLQRLQNVYPKDGKIGGDVRAVVAKDEYEAASFQLFPFKDMTVEFELSDLKSKDGSILPKEALDLKTVKIWLQNGNAWYSYFSDTDLLPVPELLLNDENLIRPDFKTKANYARVKRNGKDEYLWISPERYVDTSYAEHGWMTFSAFRPMHEDFRDAETLQPISLKPGEFKQMWLTVHADKDRKEGIYRGSIGVKSNGKKVADIPVSVRILPFVLPQPKTGDLKRDFLVSFYGGPSINRFMMANGADEELADKQMRSVMKNFKAHNLLNPLLEGNSRDLESIGKQIDYRKEAGLPTKPLIGGNMIWLSGGGEWSEAELKATKDDAKRWADYLQKKVGHTNIYLMSGDEPGADWVQFMRPAWKLFQEYGLGVFTAGHDGIYLKGGHIYDVMPLAVTPENTEKLNVTNTVGYSYTGFYACQHNGSENPDYVRRQHGLLGYKSGHSMIINYEFAWGPWNDLAYDLYKPMVLAYPTRDGLVDTIEWEGFREAVDDIRYATLFKTEIERCKESKNLDTRYAARQALMWWALLDFQKEDLNTVRQEMIHYILKLRGMQ